MCDISFVPRPSSLNAEMTLPATASSHHGRVRGQASGTATCQHFANGRGFAAVSNGPLSDVARVTDEEIIAAILSERLGIASWWASAGSLCFGQAPELLPTVHIAPKARKTSRARSHRNLW